MKRELLWAQCPLCLNDIKPQLSVILGNDIFPGDKNISLTKTEIFTLYSPYELKNNIKDIVSNEQFHLLNIDKLRNTYTNIFWNCIWYFYLYNLDYSIILPYEVNLYKKKASSDNIITPFIITRISPYIRKNSLIEKNNNINNNNNKNEIIINDNNIINNNKNFNNKAIIHNNLSLEYIGGNSFNKKLSISDILDSIELKNKNDNDMIRKNYSCKDKFKTPDKKNNNNNNINSDENDIDKIDISKSNLK